MNVIPAVDVKNGKCVRLFQGKLDNETVFSENPEKMAARWEEKGAKLIHVVDLDGAVHKSLQNIESIKAILKAVSVPIELGGGIRDLDSISFLVDLGVGKIILGTAAYKDPNLLRVACSRYPGIILAGIDARDNRVAIDGWTRETPEPPEDLARKLEDSGIAAIIYTDIARDGMRSGPNLKNISSMCKAVTIPVICAGGITVLDDIKNLLNLKESNLEGAVTGRAIYEGTLDLKQALLLCEGNAV